MTRSLGLSSEELASIANELRESIIEMLTEAKSGHPGGSLSAIDIITALWFSEMRGVEGPDRLSEDRDRFILSKGHAVPALYAVLAKKGFIDPAELKTLRKTGSLLQGHPDRQRMPILETSTGSLGQGLSVAQGMAIAAQLDRKHSRIYCLLGDGEIQEGQVWEAAMSAAKYKLSNLCAIVDYNKGQIDGSIAEIMPLEPLADKWRAFGWQVIEMDGHDMSRILTALREAREYHEKGAAKPVVIIAHTVKGKGVSFMENKMEWHGSVPKPEQARQAIDEIRKAGGRTHG
jgi:transketolase